MQRTIRVDASAGCASDDTAVWAEFADRAKVPSAVWPMIDCMVDCACTQIVARFRRSRAGLRLACVAALAAAAGCAIRVDELHHELFDGGVLADVKDRCNSACSHCAKPFRSVDDCECGYCQYGECSEVTCGDVCSSEYDERVLCDEPRAAVCRSDGDCEECPAPHEGHKHRLSRVCHLYEPEAGIFNFCTPPASLGALPPPPPGRFFPVPVRPVFSPQPFPTAGYGGYSGQCQ